MTDAAMSNHIDAIRDILGEAAVLVGTDTASYASGARFDNGTAAFVLRPTTTEQVSAAISYCVRHDIAVVPQSGNTGVVGGSTPDASALQVVLSLDRLNRKLEIDSANRSVRLDAGIRMSQLDAALAPLGLFFPIDLGSDPMIGGMLATNTGGARFLKYGDVRRNTLGLTVVLGDRDGTVLDLSTHLRKNNTGIDWKHLFIGTSGAFGIITECVLNLERRPQQAATALLVPADAAAVLPILELLETAFGDQLSAFEGMSGEAIKAALAHVPSLRNPFERGVVPPYVILVEVTRQWPVRDEQPLNELLTTALGQILERDETLLADALLGRSEEMWALRHAISDGVKNIGKLVGFDISLRRGDIMPFCERMTAEVAAKFPGVRVCDFGHIGDGGVHFNLAAEKDSAAYSDPDFERNVRTWLYDIVVNDYGGSFSAEHGIGRKNQAYFDRHTSDLKKGLAAQFKAILSPGALGAARFW